MTPSPLPPLASATLDPLRPVSTPTLTTPLFKRLGRSAGAPCGPAAARPTRPRSPKTSPGAGRGSEYPIA
jgi:hypothetical protein